MKTLVTVAIVMGALICGAGQEPEGPSGAARVPLEEWEQLAEVPINIGGVTIWYVDQCGPPPGGCTSWSDACPDLQTALSLASAGDQIWVAAGTYKPDSGLPDLDATFHLISAVAIYGGFDGTETSLEDRAGLFDQTILSGALDAVPSDCCVIHDTPGCDCAGCSTEVCAFLPQCCENQWNQLCTGLAEVLCPGLCDDGWPFNVYHVVTGIDVDETALLDGFTITGGQAGGSCCVDDRGGGLFLSFSSPTVRHCKLRTNSATNVGGAAWIDSSSPAFIDCTFEENIAGPFGGPDGAAIHNVLGSDLTLIRCVFRNNGAAQGAAIWISGNIFGNPASSVIASRCTFIGNSGSAGGAILNNGFANFSNCLFAGNEAFGVGFPSFAGKGGAIANFGELTLTNCTIFANSAVVAGGGLYTGDDSSSTNLDPVMSVTNCILWGNTAPGETEAAQIASLNADLTVNYSCVQGLTGQLGGVGNIGADPLFVDAAGLDEIPGTEDDNLRVSARSPCIDAADNTAVPEGIVTDLDGLPRFVDDPNTDDTGFGDPPIVDMGAYEFRDPCADDDGGRVTICHVPPGNPDNAHTITVSIHAFSAHLAHGDYCGPCEDDRSADSEAGRGENKQRRIIIQDKPLRSFEYLESAPRSEGKSTAVNAATMRTCLTYW